MKCCIVALLPATYTLHALDSRQNKPKSLTNFYKVRYTNTFIEKDYYYFRNLMIQDIKHMFLSAHLEHAKILRTFSSLFSTMQKNRILRAVLYLFDERF